MLVVVHIYRRSIEKVYRQMSASAEEKVLDLARKGVILRPRDLQSKGLPADGVVCLLSALRFHGLTTQSPFEIWMAIDGKARSPKEDIIPLRIVRFSGKALTAGVESCSIEGVRVRVYNPAKTIADCFKYSVVLLLLPCLPSSLLSKK